MPARTHYWMYSSTTLGISFGEKAWRSMESSIGRTTGSRNGESDPWESGDFSDRSFLLWIMVVAIAISGFPASRQRKEIPIISLRAVTQARAWASRAALKSEAVDHRQEHQHGRRPSADVASRLGDNAGEVLRPRRWASIGFGREFHLQRSNRAVTADGPDQKKKGDCTGRPDQRVVRMEQSHEREQSN